MIAHKIEIFRTQGDAIPIRHMYEYASEEGRTLAQGFDVRIPDGEGSTKLAFHGSGRGERFSIRLTRESVNQAKRLRSPLSWYQISPVEDLSMADTGCNSGKRVTASPEPAASDSRAPSDMPDS